MTNKRSPRERNGSAWEPVHDILEGVEQAVAGGWYPARRMLLSRLAEAARPRFAVWVPEADVEEGPREFAVSFALPGVDKSDIRVNVTEDTLTVSGRRREDEGALETGRRELPRGEFLRRVRLPDEIKPGSAKAACRNGVLRVTLERARVRAGRSVKVD
ncbi:MAG: Hsp20/alpha crystallin family protein [Elusimicrobia bacterium]|nr:Hsp20/alpha crystallin family protein [Elusimicrobiota bacterium]